MSARIDLSSGGLCASGIDRTKPAILQPYMQDYEWQKFCDDIDEALRPINFWSKIAAASFGLTFVTFAVCIILTMVSFGGGMPSFALFAVPAATILLGFLCFCFIGMKSSQASLEIQRVCRETSNRQPQLSFHVRYERYWGFNTGGHHHHGTSTRQYIEVSINTAAIPSGAAAAAMVNTSPYVVSAAGRPTGVDTSSSTPADRLIQLEKVKTILTQEEYERKKAEILADM